MKISEIENYILENIKNFILENEIEINEININTRLIGNSGIFDSMDLVRFIVELEESFENDFSFEISLTSEKAMSRSTSPFINASTLAKFIQELLNE